MGGVGEGEEGRRQRRITYTSLFLLSVFLSSPSLVGQMPAYPKGREVPEQNGVDREKDSVAFDLVTCRNGHSTTHPRFRVRDPP